MSKKTKQYYDKKYVAHLLEQQKHDYPKSNNSDEQHENYLDKIQDGCEKLNRDLDRKFDE